MNCITSGAALTVVVISIFTIVMALSTNTALSEVVQLLQNMGIDARKYEDLKIKWVWIILFAIGNLVIWSLILKIM